MSSNKTSQLFSSFLRSATVARIGYPLGVAVVFCLIFLSAFFSYRFFFMMIERATTLQSLEVSEGVTFHLDAYHAIAKAFTALTPPSSMPPAEQKRASVVAFRNAQLRNDRVILLQELLKNVGWAAKAIEDEEIPSEQRTTIAVKETYEKDADTILALLLKNGFIVQREKPLSTDAKFDILITLGAY